MGKNTNDFDKDLNTLLEIASNEDLDYLVELIKGTWTNFFEIEDAYKQHAPNHTEYADLLASHVRRFGGNSFVNLGRGIFGSTDSCSVGPKYHEVVCDVAKFLKVNFNKEQPVELIEESIFAKVITDTLDKMSDDEKRNFLDSIGVTNLNGTGPALTAAAIAVFRAGGFKSYQLAVTIVNAILKKLIGRGLPFVGGPILTQSLKFLTGPVGWVVTGVWGLVDAASDAKRITVPAVLYIGTLRKKYNTPVCTKCQAQIPPSSKFCPECGAEIG